ncbi:hypothetical protein N7493_007917 [Penicillium malachiteum]|uniref:Zn(2)-C6 fungal-type domain-containing protein n=1 Tax=Penicillium malachiteum TaxID=1324776 RepID=A0AAD6HIW7_9EURO|nr:hypothetical protein N7493_007917 [Penicillium malachiteum]
MPRAPKPPVKAACLACRSSKTRCDGQYPCKSCYNKDRDCSYQPSRRGGARRGARYAETLQNRASNNEASPMRAQSVVSSSNTTESIDPFLDNAISLLTPFVGINNLDQSPDTLFEGNEAIQLWGQLTPDGDSSFAPPPDTQADFPIRVYRCEEDILNAYYIYMHPYFPLLPSSLTPVYEDRGTDILPLKPETKPERSDLPYWPNSSLSLALSAVLVLIPAFSDPTPMHEKSLLQRRSYAQLFAHAALSSAERGIDELSPASSINVIGASVSQEQSPLHPQVPLQLDPILALVVLATYEYCQRGNVSRMRARINNAITTAMDISLHSLGSTTTEFSEAQRRAWWMIMFVAHISSNLHLTPPIIAADDPRIKTPFPTFGVGLEPWSFTIRAQTLLYAAHSMVQRIERVAETPLSSDLGKDIKNLDNQILFLLIESDQSLREIYDFEEGESIAAQNLWRISRIMIHTARIRLHRFRAFMDIPLFLDRYCDLISINTHGFAHPSSESVTRWQSTFPFTEEESTNICLKAALVIANSFRSLPYPHACGPDTYPGTEISDAERLIEELRHGVESLGTILKQDHIFEGVAGVGREIESAYFTAFPDHPQIEI